LWEDKTGNGLLYRCRVGHEWTNLALVDGQERELENALWLALRIVGERRQMALRMRDRAVAHGHRHIEMLLTRRLEELDALAERLRVGIEQPVTPPVADADLDGVELDIDEADSGTV
jgi:two-component system chemotaxis response regulator CheB